MSFGRDIAQGVGAIIVVAFIVAFALGALVMWGLPLLWHWLKPIIHGLTQ